MDKRRKIAEADPSAELTALDVVRELEELREEAEAQDAAGWGNADVCSYDEGYVDQPVYSCLACTKTLGRQFGFCYACSMHCHVDHTIPSGDEKNRCLEKDAVIELFDKRAFRCDCPTSGFCQLQTRANTSAAPINTLNKYGHNFDGLYCWCNQPYDHDSDVVMIQCELCQDWFHQECIQKETGKPVPTHSDDNSAASEDELSQFVCRECISSYPFLKQYGDMVFPSSVLEQHDLNFSLSDQTNCKLVGREPTVTGSVFFHYGWKNLLCRCPACCDMYRKLGVDFVLKGEQPETGETDAVESPDGLAPAEDQGDPSEPRNAKRKREDGTPAPSAGMFDLFEAGMQQLQSLPFTQKLDMLHHYNHLKSELHGFFHEFVSAGKVVTQADILKFFNQLSSQK